MLFFKFSAVWCLFVLSTKGFDIEFEETFRNNDAGQFDLRSQDLIKFDWSFNTPSGGYRYTHSDDKHETSSHSPDEAEDFDSWSVVWYIASFGGLIGFFLIVSCSEWCCRKHIRENQARRSANSPTAPLSCATETPPPAYDLFAPPSYESLNTSQTSEKTEYDVYVVPVHAIGSLVESGNSGQREEHPPSYTSINIEETNARTSAST